MSEAASTRSIFRASLATMFFLSCHAATGYNRTIRAAATPSWNYIGIDPIKEGDVLRKSGHLFLAVGSNEITYISTPPCIATKKVHLQRVTISNEDLLLYDIVTRASSYDSRRALKLAYWLFYSELPYAWFSCNEKHWMKYIIYGRAHYHFLNCKCPLFRSLSDVPADAIGRDFALKYSRKRSVLISELGSRHFYRYVPKIPEPP